MKSVVADSSIKTNRAKALRHLLASGLLVAGGMSILMVLWCLLGGAVMAIKGMVKIEKNTDPHDYPGLAILAISSVWPIAIYLCKKKII